jgi:hypothetical protein
VEKRAQPGSHTLTPHRETRGEVPEFLIAFLSAGPVPVKEIEEAAAAQLISKRTLERAKEDLHIIVDKDRSTPGAQVVLEITTIGLIYVKAGV